MVVLPLVPVTATVGIVRVEQPRRVTGVRAAHRVGGCGDPVVEGHARARSRRTSTRAWPIASPVPSRTQGKATTTVPSPPVRLTAGPTYASAARAIRSVTSHRSRPGSVGPARVTRMAGAGMSAFGPRSTRSSISMAELCHVAPARIPLTALL